MIWRSVGAKERVEGRGRPFMPVCLVELRQKRESCTSMNTDRNW